MKIDINNYEAFFLDFVEGRLDDASTLEMLAFLRNHPHLKSELENFGDVRLDPAEIVFNEKATLKKFDFGAAVNVKNFDDFCVAYYEKLLTRNEEEKLFEYLRQFPEKRSDFLLYGKTSLKGDPSIIFEAKPFLKKKSKALVRTIILRWTAVAAGIVLVVSVFYRSPDKPKEIETKAISSISKKVEVNASKEKAVTEKKQIYNSVPKQVVIAQVQPENIIPEKVERVENLPLLNPIKVKKIESVYDSPENQLLAIDIPAISIEQEKEFEVLDYAEKMFREKVLKTDESKPKKKFSLWDLADLTLKGYNSLSEKDIVLHRKMDENGKLTAIAIETENKKFGFETKN